MVKKTKSEFLKQEAESFPESKFEKKIRPQKVALDGTIGIKQGFHKL